MHACSDVIFCVLPTRVTVFKFLYASVDFEAHDLISLGQTMAVFKRLYMNMILESYKI
jgi:hypothetical protein